MTTPVTRSTPSVSTQPAQAPPAAPAGVGAQPTTLASAAEPKACFDSIFSKIRSAFTSLFDSIGSFFGMIARWIKGTPAPEPPNQWQLPAPTVPAPTATTADPFQQLPITDQERQWIYDLIHTMGTNSEIALLWHKGRLEQIGRDIDHVHPLKLLEYVLKHPVLHKDMDAIRGGMFTWRNFINGISAKLQANAATTLPTCKEGFARSINVSLTDIDPYIARSDWNGMVQNLIDIKNGKKHSQWTEAPAPTTQPAPPPTGIAALPYDQTDERILQDLMKTYAESTRLGLWNNNSLSHLWSHVGERHPLKVLSYLFSRPELMTKLDTIFQTWGTKALFVNAFSAQLSIMPFHEVRPHIEEFSARCRLSPARVQSLIQDRNWNDLLADLLRSYQAN